MQVRSRRSLPVMLSVAVATVGCASVPTTPGGPLQRAGTLQGSATEIVDASVLTSTIGTPNGETSRATHLSWDAGGIPPVPSQLGGRVSFADWGDVELDWGLSGIGGEIRAGAPEQTRLPFAVSIGAHSGALIPVTLADAVREQHDLGVRLELYPHLPLLAAPRGRRLSGVLAVGVSDGVHYHDVTLQAGQSPFEFLRAETRVEGALGIELRIRNAVASLIALPYVVARGSSPTMVSCGIAHCEAFDGGTLRAFQQDLGVSIALTLGLSSR